MIGGESGDRFATMRDVVAALENALGVGEGRFTPTPEQITVIENGAELYENAPTARRRSLALLGFSGVVGFLILVSLLAGWPRLVGGFLGLGLLSALAYFLIVGLTQGSPLFDRARSWVLGGTMGDRLTWLAALALGIVALKVLGLFWVWLFFSIAAFFFALAVHLGLDRRLATERLPALDAVEPLLASLRRQGHSEDTLRRFVCRYAGDRWEPFYEDLFGYDALRDARRHWRQIGGQPRPRSGLWRDPIADWLDVRLQSRERTRLSAFLQPIMEEHLQARGVYLLTARRRSWRAVPAMVGVLRDLGPTAVSPNGVPSPGPSLSRALAEAANRPEEVLVEQERSRFDWKVNIMRLVGLILGPRVRFFAGALLVIGCLTWMSQNALIPGRAIHEAASKVVETGDVEHLKTMRDLTVEVTKPTQPLDVPMLPTPLAELLGGFDAGLAGLILLVSALFRGGFFPPFAVLGAIIASAGAQVGLPAVGPFEPESLSMIVGCGLAAVGFLLSSRPRLSLPQPERRGP